MRSKLTTLLPLASLLLSPAAARCAALPVMVTNAAPEIGSYSYDIRWQGLTAGKARIVTVHTNGHYLIATTANTDNLARHLLTARYFGMARVAPDLHARDVVENRTIRKRQVVTYSRFDDDDAIEIVQAKARPKRSVKIRELRLEEGGAAIDPFTAVLRARAVPWEKGRQVAYVLLVGDDRYRLTLTCRGGTRIKVEGKRHPVWHLRPKLELYAEPGSAAPEDAEDRAGTIKAVSKADIYIARDARQQILRIETDSLLGTFDVVLTGFRAGR